MADDDSAFPIPGGAKRTSGTKPSAYLVLHTVELLMKNGIVTVSNKDEFWQLCSSVIPYLQQIDYKLGKPLG